MGPEKLISNNSVVEEQGDQMMISVAGCILGSIILTPGFSQSLV
jgi:hypothetical protein